VRGTGSTLLGVEPARGARVATARRPLVSDEVVAGGEPLPYELQGLVRAAPMKAPPLAALPAVSDTRRRDYRTLFSDAGSDVVLYSQVGQSALIAGNSCVCRGRRLVLIRTVSRACRR
jgi:hypothetical protein